mgnify:CR=1 FL=1
MSIVDNPVTVSGWKVDSMNLSIGNGRVSVLVSLPVAPDLFLWITICSLVLDPRLFQCLPIPSMLLLAIHTMFIWT